MERSINAYQVNPNLLGLNQNMKDFLIRDDIKVIRTKTFTRENIQLTVTHESAKNENPGKKDFQILRFAFIRDGATTTFITNPYIDGGFTGKLNEIFEGLEDDNVFKLNFHVIFYNERKIVMSGGEEMLGSFRQDRYADTEQRGFTRDVPRAERNHRENRGYRSRFGHRNSEDHRRNVIHTEDIARHLLKPILGRGGVNAFFGDNQVKGDIENVNANFERVNGGQVITLVVQIKVEDI